MASIRGHHQGVECSGNVGITTTSSGGYIVIAMKGIDSENTAELVRNLGGQLADFTKNSIRHLAA